MDYSSLLSRPVSYFGKEQVWMARGGDVALFNSHRSNIQNYLKHSDIPESTQSPWIGLYRIGKSPDEASTVLVVSCSDRRIRRLTRNVLRNCPLFQQGGALAHFKIISKATPPETSSEPELTMQLGCEVIVEPSKVLISEGTPRQSVDEHVQGHTQSHISLRLEKSQTGDRYLCRRVQALQWSQEGVLQSQTATLGPLLCVGGDNYQLTVEHVINFGSRGSDATLKSTEDDWDSDDDDYDDDDEEEDGSTICPLDEEIAPWDESKGGIGSGTNSSTEGNLSDSASSYSLSELVTPPSKPDTSSGFRMDHPRPPTLVNTTPTGSEGIYNLIVHDSSSPSNPNTRKPPTQCRASSEIDYLLIPMPTRSEQEPFINSNTEMIEPSDAFRVHEQTEPRSVIIATGILGYVKGVIFPASTLLRKPRSQSFHTLFCITSHESMPKGVSGSAVFDTQTGLLA
ncbi:hypothetical protein ACHAQK_012294, partial [Fusarium lateritium]